MRRVQRVTQCTVPTANTELQPSSCSLTRNLYPNVIHCKEEGGDLPSVSGWRLAVSACTCAGTEQTSSADWGEGEGRGGGGGEERGEGRGRERGGGHNATN